MENKRLCRSYHLRLVQTIWVMRKRDGVKFAVWCAVIQSEHQRDGCAVTPDGCLLSPRLQLWDANSRGQEHSPVRQGVVPLRGRTCLLPVTSTRMAPQAELSPIPRPDRQELRAPAAH